MYGDDVLSGKQHTMILPAHDSQSVPLGKATVYQTDSDLRADLKFNLKIEDGLKWFEALKFDMANGESKQQYSYGFGVLDSEQEVRDGEPVNVLKRLDIFEVSPVIRGAGNNTRTVSLKGGAGENQKASATIAASEVQRVAKRWGISP